MAEEKSTDKTTEATYDLLYRIRFPGVTDEGIEKLPSYDKFKETNPRFSIARVFISDQNKKFARSKNVEDKINYGVYYPPKGVFFGFSYNINTLLYHDGSGKDAQSLIVYYPRNYGKFAEYHKFVMYRFLDEEKRILTIQDTQRDDVDFTFNDNSCFTPLYFSFIIIEILITHRRIRSATFHLYIFILFAIDNMIAIVDEMNRMRIPLDIGLSIEHGGKHRTNQGYFNLQEKSILIKMLELRMECYKSFMPFIQINRSGIFKSCRERILDKFEECIKKMYTPIDGYFPTSLYSSNNNHSFNSRFIENSPLSVAIETGNYVAMRDIIQIASSDQQLYDSILTQKDTSGLSPIFRLARSSHTLFYSDQEEELFPLLLPRGLSYDRLIDSRGLSPVCHALLYNNINFAVKCIDSDMMAYPLLKTTSGKNAVPYLRELTQLFIELFSVPDSWTQDDMKQYESRHATSISGLLRNGKIDQTIYDKIHAWCMKQFPEGEDFILGVDGPLLYLHNHKYTELAADKKTEIPGGLLIESLENYINVHMSNADKSKLDCPIPSCNKPLTRKEISSFVDSDTWYKFSMSHNIHDDLSETIKTYNTMLFNSPVQDPTGYGLLHQNGICPFCIQSIGRDEGCMYMTHERSSAPKGTPSPYCQPHFLIPEILKKYRDSYKAITGKNDSTIRDAFQFCIECGRPCYDHEHFSLDGKSLIKHAPGDAFQVNPEYGRCTGGGKAEKLARILAIRDVYSSGKYKNKKEERKAAAFAADKAPLNPEYMERAKAILRIPTPNDRKWNKELIQHEYDGSRDNNSEYDEKKEEQDGGQRRWSKKKQVRGRRETRKGRKTEKKRWYGKKRTIRTRRFSHTK